MNNPVSRQNQNYDTPPNPPVMLKISVQNTSEKIKGKKLADRKTENKLPILPETAIIQYQSGKKAGNLLKNHLTRSYLILPDTS